MPKGIKGFLKGHSVSDETKHKIGVANSRPVYFRCEYCGNISTTKLSAYNRCKRHFCSMSCYAKYRKEYLRKEEQPRFGTGMSREESDKRKKAREILNRAIRDGKLFGPLPCEVCQCIDNVEAHHDDYNNPLNVRWLCFKHHRKWHRDNPELLEVK